MSEEVTVASAAELHHALLGRNERVGCAESLTGGELAAWLSSTPGASATFVGAVVSYASEVKRDVLGVTAAKVVSPDCAEQMASGVRQLLGVDWALSTTGVAGPDEQEGQAVGTVYVGVASTQRVRSVRLALEGDRQQIRSAVCAAAVELLLEEVTHG
jgi:nicotinamide-nucleotide amidase